MSDQDNLFNKEEVVDNTTNDTPNESNTPTVADLLSGITNEDGKQKYDSVEKALGSLGSSQTHIQRLEAEAKNKDDEIKSLRDTAERVAMLEETISKLTAGNNQDEPVKTDHQDVGSLSEEAVMALVQKTLHQRDQITAAQSNVNRVESALVSRYGEKAGDIILAKAKELNTTAKALGSLSETNPDMVLALFNSQGSGKPSPTTGSTNIPFVKTEHPELAPPTKSLINGGTSAELRAYMKQVQEEVYRKYGVVE